MCVLLILLDLYLQLANDVLLDNMAFIVLAMHLARNNRDFMGLTIFVILSLLIYNTGKQKLISSLLILCGSLLSCISQAIFHKVNWDNYSLYDSLVFFCLRSFELSINIYSMLWIHYICL